MKDFDDYFYLVIPLIEEEHMKVYCLELGFTPTYSDIFHKYCTQDHYLTRVGLCTYKKGDLSLEELYLKIQHVALYKEFNCVGGASRNRSKKCIQTYWLVDVTSKEEKRRIFCKWR